MRIVSVFARDVNLQLAVLKNKNLRRFCKTLSASFSVMSQRSSRTALFEKDLGVTSYEDLTMELLPAENVFFAKISQCETTSRKWPFWVDFISECK